MSIDKRYLQSVFFMLLSSVGLTITGLLAKVGFQTLTLNSLVFWRFFVSFLICLSLLWLFRKLDEEVDLGQIKSHVLRAIFLLLSQYSFYYYLEKATLLDAVALLNTGPLFIPMLERWIIGTRVPMSAWVGILVSFLGVMLVLQPENSIIAWIGLLGLFGGFCQGMSQVLFGMNTKREASDIGVFVLMLLLAVFSAIPYFLSGDRTLVEGQELDWSVIGILIGLGVASVANQLFRAEAYKRESPSRLAAFLYISVLLAGLFDWCFLGVVPDFVSIVGAVLIILGGIIKVYYGTVQS